MRITIIILLFSQLILAQKEDHQWMFNRYSVGIDAAVYPESAGASVLDFNYDPPRYFRDSVATMDLDWTHASVCDEDGQLLLYSNGMRVSRGDHSILTGAERISFGPLWEIRTWPDEFGVEQPYGFQIEYSATFIPVPDSINQFYHIYINYDENVDTGYFTKLYGTIAPDEDGALEMINKDQVINDKIRTPGVTSCCQHANGRDWWFLQFSHDTVYTYLIDPQGIHLDRLQFLPFELQSEPAYGSAKFSAQGDKLAFFHVWDYDADIGAELVIMDFDRCDGSISNEIRQLRDSYDLESITGLEFSPSGRYLYINDWYRVMQFDLEAADLLMSETIVVEWDGSFDLSESGNTELPNSFGFLQRGPDHKIYCKKAGAGYSMHIIHEPDMSAESCRPELNHIRLPNYHLGTIPNFPTLRLGPIDGSSCDTLDIDNNPVAKWRYEQDTMDYLNIDFVDLSFYEPESWAWDFGDNNSSVERHPVHRYADDGIYEVCLTVSNENSSHTSCQEINIGMVSSLDPETEVDINIFPNPTADWMRFTLYDYVPQRGILNLYDMAGQLVASQRVYNGVNKLDLTPYKNGTYIYELIDQGQVLKTGQVIKLE